MRDDGALGFGFFIAVVGIAGVILLNSSINFKNNYFRNKTRGYTIYLNGNRIDNVDITQYQYTIDDEMKTVYLSPKPDRSETIRYYK